jgi:hypothetical protein
LARVLITAAVALLALPAFLGMGPAPAGPLNPWGIGMLVGAFLVWYGWPAGYSYRSERRAADRDRPDLMTAGLGLLLRYKPTKREPDAS